jgi:DNA repair protein RecO (recombination protein O)
VGSQKTQAITLRLTDYRETSQILSVYSRDFGRISLLAKGSKRKRAHSQGTIDLFQLLEVVFIEKAAARLHLLTESRVLEEFQGLRRELTRGYAAFFVAELLLGLTEESDPNPALFDLAVTVLGMLGETKYPNVVLHAFELRVLELIGLVPLLDGCAWCGAAIETGSASGQVAFAASAGGVVCPKCEGEAAERTYVSAGALAMLRKLSVSPLNRVERLRLSGTIGQDVRRMLARTWMHVLGREPRMFEYLR